MVKNEVEILIWRTLKKSSSPTFAVESLYKDASYPAGEPNRQGIISLAIRANQTHLAAILILQLINQKNKIPWGAVAALLAISGISLSKAESEAIWQGADEEKSSNDILNSANLEKLLAGFSERRREFQSMRLTKVAEKKSELRQNLDFLRTNRMYEQEAKVLDQIQAMFPNEPEFANERRELEVRLAHDVLQNSNWDQGVLSDQLALKVDRLTPVQQKFKDLLITQIEVKAKTVPEYVLMDLALCLLFMDFSKEAVDLLGNRKLSEPNRWLRLEMMIKARQFVSALDECSVLESEFAMNPETIFAVTYARARSFWGLGQVQSALELMTSLARVRPQYKSVQSLLTDWTTGLEP